jgi:hypothetical protein
MEYSVLFASKLRQLCECGVYWFVVYVCVCVSVNNEKVITPVFKMCLLDSDTACLIVY